jgi:hypothetical protein
MGHKLQVVWREKRKKQKRAKAKKIEAFKARCGGEHLGCNPCGKVAGARVLHQLA